MLATRRKIFFESFRTRLKWIELQPDASEVAEVDGGLDVTPEVVVEQQLQVELDARGQTLQELVAGQLLELETKWQLVSGKC